MVFAIIVDALRTHILLKNRYEISTLLLRVNNRFSFLYWNGDMVDRKIKRKGEIKWKN